MWPFDSKLDGKILRTTGFEDLFPKKDDDLWREWSSSEGSSCTALLQSTARIGFKARAATLLILPNLAWSPFYAGKDVADTVRYSFKTELDFRDLPPRIGEWALGVIECSTKIDPKDLEKDRERDWYRTHQDYLHQLLDVLPPPAAERAFERVDFLDPLPFSGMDFCSGYHPFGRLLRDRRVTETWKRRADGKMREVVLSEIEGRSAPRETWEAAPACYEDEITTQCFSTEGLYYSKDLFADQIAFLASREIEIGKHLFPYLIKIFDEPAYAETRRQICASICREERLFFDHEDVLAAERCLRDLSQGGHPYRADQTDVALILREAIGRYHQREKEAQLAAVSKREQSKVLVQRMS